MSASGYKGDCGDERKQYALDHSRVGVDGFTPERRENDPMQEKVGSDDGDNCAGENGDPPENLHSRALHSQS